MKPGDNMAEKKHSAFAVLDILTAYSDEDHILTAKEIMRLLEAQYGLKIERRTLYSNLDILEQSGFKVSRYEDNGKGYFLEEKQFDKGEILLLCNALHASHFISSKQSGELIRKLLKTQSKYEAKEFQGNIYLPNSWKTSNSELMYNIRLASEAIRDHKKIRFTYMRYDRTKKLVPRRKEPYIVEPRGIVYADSRAYLIVTQSKYYDFVHYRLDRISRASLVEETSKELPAKCDPYEYARNKLFMYAGETVSVKFLCHERIMDQMIDIFGSDVFISPQDGEHFVLSVTAGKQGVIFLAQQFLDSMEILEPESLRKEFAEELERVLASYKK